MSEEVFEMICAMDRRGIELQIVLQCAPTLAGLKTSNLLIVPVEDEDKVRYVLRSSGLLGYRLVYDKKRVVFLVFNRTKLNSYLFKKEVRDFLGQAGYQTDAFGYVLRTFQKRYDAYIHDRQDFPHEMGVLLGYPVCDVKGFIEHGGQDFLLSGYWKVYDHAAETKELFRRFDLAKDQMVKQIFAGMSVKEIIQANNNAFFNKEAV